MTDQPPADGASVTISQDGISDIVPRLLIELADRADTDLDALPPLYERVDPDALTKLLEHSTGHLSVSFDYAGYRITVTDSGQLEFDPQSNAPISD